MATAPLIAQRFREQFGEHPQCVVSAPGRVNLIGEHTDYNDGYVLPMAIDRRVHVAMATRNDQRIVAHSEEFDETWELGHTIVDNLRTRRWSDYVLGIMRVLTNEGYQLPGMNLYLSGGVPVGAGISSSAAVEIAVLRAVCCALEEPWDAIRFARLAQKAENDIVGVQCGVMDQITAAAGRAGRAILLDCRSLAMSYVSVPAHVAVVLMDTGLRRSLSGTDYNARRSVCDYVVSRIRTIAPQVRALRDVSPALLETSRMLLDATAYRRAKHVIDENARPPAFARALGSGDLRAAGALLDASHESLRTLFEVSSIHLDLICEAAREHPACFGARLTGAGFAGCAIALVRGDQVRDFIRETQPRYEAQSYKRSDFFVVSADDGARVELAD